MWRLTLSCLPCEVSLSAFPFYRRRNRLREAKRLAEASTRPGIISHSDQPGFKACGFPFQPAFWVSLFAGEAGTCPPASPPPLGISPAQFTASGTKKTFLSIRLWMIRNPILAEPPLAFPPSTVLFIPLVQQVTLVTTPTPCSGVSVTKDGFSRFGGRLHGRQA